MQSLIQYFKKQKSSNVFMSCTSCGKYIIIGVDASHSSLFGSKLHQIVLTHFTKCRVFLIICAYPVKVVFLFFMQAIEGHAASWWQSNDICIYSSVIFSVADHTTISFNRLDCRAVVDSMGSCITWYPVSAVVSWTLQMSGNFLLSLHGHCTFGSYN